ncbi:hypothetical protein GFH48_00580 [Streptomyces fagopyri]|uniref:Enoyl-CoA hydratase n=1 Tax=Streptomyces fagopyri TaxID=2662397 RepID=A0A5Q0L4L2_9ACTN|nr:enoyl-CoA hydratase-related protein [Streptomyces fagopyri]QFZ71965.1 hypothetical protein GFH48_00580 [Streptomyces fagopyri]
MGRRLRRAGRAITLGFPPPFGGSQRLPRHIGRRRSLELTLTGDPIEAARSADLSLVNRVVPADILLDGARAPAERIIRHPASVVAAALSESFPRGPVRHRDTVGALSSTVTRPRAIRSARDRGHAIYLRLRGSCAAFRKQPGVHR